MSSITLSFAHTDVKYITLYYNIIIYQQIKRPLPLCHTIFDLLNLQLLPAENFIAFFIFAQAAGENKFISLSNISLFDITFFSVVPKYNNLSFNTPLFFYVARYLNYLPRDSCVSALLNRKRYTSRHHVTSAFRRLNEIDCFFFRFRANIHACTSTSK